MSVESPSESTIGPRSRRRFQLAYAGAAVLLILVSWVVVVARRPGNESFGAKAAEWGKENHLGGVVLLAERLYYTWKAPPAGGTPNRTIAVATSSSTTTTVAVTASTTIPKTTTTTLPHSTLPPPVQTPAANPLPGEGQWVPIGPRVDGHPTMALAQVRPDAVHTSVLAGLVWMDPKLVTFGVRPGNVDPPGNWKDPGVVPPALMPKLIAAFNGGFKVRDANGGLYVDGEGANTLVNGAASFVTFKDGSVTVGQWGRDVSMSPNVSGVLQNLVLLIDGGKPVAGLNQNDISKWGKTLGNQVLVWRTGVGVRADGTVVYVAGNGLSIVTLADLMVRAGIVRGMTLDMNPFWATFNVFSHPDPSNPSLVKGTKLLPDMQRPANRFAVPDSRDFIAVYARY